MYALILASSSPRRQAIVSAMGIPFTIVKPQIDETQHADERPLAYVRRLSRRKAHAVAVSGVGDDAVILAADTIVVLDAQALTRHTTSRILGKPANADEARAMLVTLRGRVHQVCTSFTLYRLVDGAEYTLPVCTSVLMRDYSDAEIDAYIATGDPFDKAGGYAIQHEGFAPVASITGSRDNVVGLPSDDVARGLRLFGFAPHHS